ncbi:hypothetical protein DERF_005623 [Dermatophagoides farinae]|uniref:Uncharacterized protein n=1 Tax=Dermatophagoides farinae TaxID=6954 RepID=A0A922I9V1_DERFA|nr:hypothetical protein DERF_005623 [Dermatophagoides farinae]
MKLKTKYQAIMSHKYGKNFQMNFVFHISFIVHSDFQYIFKLSIDQSIDGLSSIRIRTTNGNGFIRLANIFDYS